MEMSLSMFMLKEKIKLQKFGLILCEFAIILVLTDQSFIRY
ncbi:hypothetical protein Cabys_3699 [Caldithrix abyssi DSM 13497]|uniref:Uncharacterized protein n=1 Tax=Caldithrix abyssi DSM 13497 TaxID=880073 RepID=A0A1J1CCK2_CALAY|nr:hypothetical protein Cabys_3699 [Caldithrix abyssi DSM 13497]